MGVCVERHHLCVLLELGERGNLRQVLDDHPELPLWRRFQLLHGAALGCAALQAHTPRPILHHDIKTVNLLVAHDWTCKLADFGLATGLGTLPTATKGGGEIPCPRAPLRYTGMVQAARTLLKEEGAGIFARGLQARLMIHAPSVAICWTTYESVKHLLVSNKLLE